MKSISKTIIIVILVFSSVAGIIFVANKLTGDSSSDDSQTPLLQSFQNGKAAPFTEYHLDYTDPEGFSYNVTCKISPWILQSDKEVLNATWSGIAKNKELPTINTWGFRKSGDYYRYTDSYITTFDSKIDDMYYAVGTVSIKNVTPGFDFSADRVGYPKIEIAKNLFKNTDKKLITRVYFSNEELTSAFTAKIDAKMTSNSWGPVPFVIAYAEHFTPNNPKGENYDEAEQLELYLLHAEATNQDLVPIKIEHLK